MAGKKPLFYLFSTVAVVLIVLAHLLIFCCVAVVVENQIGHAVCYISGFVAVAVQELGFSMWLL